jgi:hypothetical protein
MRNPSWRYVERESRGRDWVLTVVVVVVWSLCVWYSVDRLVRDGMGSSYPVSLEREGE